MGLQILGIDVDRAAKRRHRFIQPPLQRQQIAQIVPGLGRLRRQVNGLAQAGLGRRHVAHRLLRQGQIDQNPGRL